MALMETSEGRTVDLAKDKAVAQRQYLGVVAENDRLSRIVARVDPKEIKKRLPARQKTYNKALDDRFVALASTGMSIPEIRAECGVLYDDFREWQQHQPSFKAAVNLAADIGLAYWMTQSRKAMTTGDNKFPFAAFQKFLSQYQLEVDNSALGDASDLVMIDLRDKQTIEEEESSDEDEEGD